MSPQMLAWPCASRGKPGLNTFGRTEWGPLGLRDAVHAGSAWARPAASGPRPPSARERATRRGWRARCAWRTHTPGRPCSEVRPGPGEWSVVRTHSLESAPMRGLRLAPGGSRSPASETSKTPSTVGVQLDSRTRGRPDVCHPLPCRMALWETRLGTHKGVGTQDVRGLQRGKEGGRGQSGFSMGRSTWVPWGLGGASLTPELWAPPR